MAELFFKNHPEIIAAMSTRENGSCRLWPPETKILTTLNNRAEFFRSIGIPPENVVGAILGHTNIVLNATGRDRGRSFDKIDGFVTKEPGVFVSITAADCLPIFLYEPDAKVVGVLHAGWRGLEEGIVFTGLRRMEALGAEMNKILVAIGPSIGSCHFEVQSDVAEKFTDFPGAREERDGKIYLDLRRIAETMLVASGISPENIEISSECTYCLPEKYFSYRRDKPKIMEAMVAAIGLKV